MQTEGPGEAASNVVGSKQFTKSLKKEKKKSFYYKPHKYFGSGR